ncbi:hypothetical protein GCM10011608_02360 [Micromonospora sonchi]|uniref:Spore-associated protein A n=1 Tax=Micromonospora sonchi TaxID=1763543 RepID=A0A917TF24_9ACTN|nr:hypothetical protein GCM10011608_02360 [Micromonospora sonchi]
MRRFARRLAVSILSATVAAVTLAAPAQAAFTAAQACNNDFGGSWAHVSDGHRSITTPSGTKVGDVYLMYNSASATNCVATIKRVSVGTNSGVSAGIRVEGSSWAYDPGSYKYYAAIQRSARDKCVMYSGEVLYGTSWQSAGRYSWGNCG